jgi:hypothetical protein
MNLAFVIAASIATLSAVAILVDFYRSRHDRRLNRLIRRSKGRW